MSPRGPLRLCSGAALSGLLALTVSSCATLRQMSFERPTVELDALELTALDLDGASLKLWLDVYNPNGYELRTTRIEADLDLEDTHLGSASLEKAIVLAPLAHTVVELPARVSWEGLGAGARALLERGAVDYVLDTRLRVNTSLGNRTVRFRTHGEVPILDRSG